MNAIREWLQGKKTNIASIGAIVTAIGAYAEGALTLEQAATAVLLAMMGMFLGAKIDRVAK